MGCGQSNSLQVSNSHEQTNFSKNQEPIAIITQDLLALNEADLCAGNKPSSPQAEIQPLSTNTIHQENKVSDNINKQENTKHQDPEYQHFSETIGNIGQNPATVCQRQQNNNTERDSDFNIQFECSTGVDTNEQLESKNSSLGDGVKNVTKTELSSTELSDTGNNDIETVPLLEECAINEDKGRAFNVEKATNEDDSTSDTTVDKMEFSVKDKEGSCCNVATMHLSGGSVTDDNRVSSESDAASFHAKFEVENIDQSSENKLLAEETPLNQKPSTGSNGHGDVITLSQQFGAAAQLSQNHLLHPSSGPRTEYFGVQTYEDTKNDEKLRAYMRLLCGAVDCTQLVDTASAATSLRIDRSMSLVNANVLPKVVAAMEKILNFSVTANNSGPVAFRALLAILARTDNLKYLDVSDNMADSECADSIKTLIMSCKCLTWLNLSGNQLGKESLSKSLSASISSSESLTSLNISGCGAMNLHGFLEALRVGYLQGSLPLSNLNISNNCVNDGLQLGIDLCRALESQFCRLQFLDITGTGLNPEGFAAFTGGLNSNCSLRELRAGGSQNVLKDFSALFSLILASRSLVKLSMSGVNYQESQNDLDVCATSDSSDGIILPLTELDLSGCRLSDDVTKSFALKVPSALCHLKVLNISNNQDIEETGLQSFKDLCSSNGSSNLKSLNVSLLDVEFLPAMLINSFPLLKVLHLKKSRITAISLAKLTELPQCLEEVVLDGIKLSGTRMLDSFLSLDCKHQLVSLCLANCGLIDADLRSLVNALSRLLNLEKLDISSNRLTSGMMSDIAKALMAITGHSLNYLDVSHNEIDDAGVEDLAQLICSASALCSLRSLHFSCNDLTYPGIAALATSVARNATSRGLVYLDVSNQKRGLDEEEADNIIEALVTALGLDAQRENQLMPDLSPKLTVNLTQLGGSAGPKVKLFDSTCIKTDFCKLRRSTALLSDYLLVGAGLENGITLNEILFSKNEWSVILGADAPAWLHVETERKKSVYINHLPGTATVQRLEGMLEMEADCEVREIYLVKDPIMRKPTGAAWVLFADENSVTQAVQWYADGEAQMYGTPFSISRLPVRTSDETAAASAIANREMAARERLRKQQDASDREMMEASQQVAEERAAYREAHPAYQNGRIW